MTWKDDLKRSIDALKDKDFVRESLVTPWGMTMAPTWAPVNVYVTANHARSVQRFIGSVNSSEFCGVSRGKVLMKDVVTQDDIGWINFAVRNNIPWNHFMIPSTKKYTELFDADGKTAYLYVDFNDA